MSIINGDESFPFPTTITRSEFEKFDSENIDAFLYQNHRFSSVDSLIKELDALSKELNHELLELVNNEYAGFIELGKSINGGLSLINAIKNDLKHFEGELNSIDNHLTTSIHHVDDGLRKRQQLAKLRLLVDLALQTDDHINSFENLLLLGYPSTRVMVSLYLVIQEQMNYVKHEIPENNLLKHLGHRVSSIRLELRSYLDRKVIELLKDKKGNAQELFQLQSVYAVLEAERDFLSLLSQNQTN